jgi:hypothetical protein
MCYAVAIFIVPDWRDKVNSRMGLSYQARYDNPESTIYPPVWNYEFWPQVASYELRVVAVNGQLLLSAHHHDRAVEDRTYFGKMCREIRI